MTTRAALDVFSAPLAGVNLIEASAGTGKTWTICGLYLRLLLERRLTVQQILVVTFTNAATAELRERIRTRILDLLAFLNDGSSVSPDLFIATLSEHLIHRLGIGRQDLKDRLELGLHGFDEAAIFTIHGFCQRALADNPFAAGLPMHTDLVESDRELLMEAVHDFWRRHLAHVALTTEFARYFCAKGDTPEKFGRLLARHLAKPLARHLWPPTLDDPLVPAAVLDRPYQLARDQWQSERDTITSLLETSLGSLNGRIYSRTSLDEAVQNWDAICEHDDPLAQIGGKARLLRASVLAQNTNRTRATPAHEFFERADDYLSQRDSLEISLSRERMRLLKRLFEEAAVQLQTLKRSRQEVSFNDMLSNVHERLQHPDYPWLAPAIRSRFCAALIDEFQDTDPLQLAIFQKIYAPEDSLVFLVGDPKQAIYSFRHADLHSYLRASRWAARRWSLTDNQRSSQPLLHGLNMLFEGNPGAFILPNIVYQPVVYGAKPRPAFIDASEARASLQIWRLPAATGEGLSKPLARRAAIEATAVEIARLVGAGQDGRITLDGRPLRPGDIAVLVRSRALGADVKRALSELRVGAVELSRNSIYDSPEARDWETVLRAIASPGQNALLRAALGTDLLGCDAAQIERIAGSDTLLPGWIMRIVAYRDLWLNRGFGVMYRRLLADQAVAKRLLGLPDGERRLTNCLHVGEELQQAAESHPSPDALLRFFRAAQKDEDPIDAAQLRLESDQNLVQIVTIHTCKGLEYPIVFCPFLCDGATRFGGPPLDGYEYHDEALQPVIDFQLYDKADAALARIKAIVKSEQAAETVRVLYVALTRAVHRCYLVTGPYQTKSPREESARSMLNWLVAGQSLSLAQWFDSKLTPQALEAAWQGLATSSGGAIAVDPLPQATAVPSQRSPLDSATLTTPAPPTRIATGWRLSSYSGLSYGARSEQAAGDRDARILAAPALATRPDGLPMEDILRFPRGAAAGECIHAVLESVDFTDCSGWESVIAAALITHPPSRSGDPDSSPAPLLAMMLSRLVANLTAARLPPGLRLATVPAQRRLTEFEFHFPVPHLSAAALNPALRQFGYETPTLTFGSLEGYLQGFIDLVFEHQGKFFIVDWKSNLLGYTALDYGQGPIARAMADHGYHLQYLLYTLALDRYLRQRIADYRYETHFGGVLYLFVRGVRPEWAVTLGDGRDMQTPGVFFHCPPLEVIRELGRLLGYES